MTEFIWEEANVSFPAEKLDDFLRWSISIDADDIKFKTRRPVKVSVHGKRFVATRSEVDTGRMTQLIQRIDRGMETRALGGEPQDASHIIFADENEKEKTRYRVNVTSIEVDGMQGLEVSMRRVPNYVRTFDELNVPNEIRELWYNRLGTTFINGIPGSGKSWLQNAGSRWMLENDVGNIQEYAQPIEATLDTYETGAATYSASEVGRDVASYADGIRTSLRRLSAAINVAETRDYETVNAVINAGDFGVPVYTTTHATTCAATPRRILSVFANRDERYERGAMLISQLNGIVTQRLVEPAAKEGWRYPLREWLHFDDDLKKYMLGQEMEKWGSIIQEEVERRGNSIAQAARQAYEEGHISEQAYLINGGNRGLA